MVTINPRGAKNAPKAQPSGDAHTYHLPKDTRKSLPGVGKASNVAKPPARASLEDLLSASHVAPYLDAAAFLNEYGRLKADEAANGNINYAKMGSMLLSSLSDISKSMPAETRHQTEAIIYALNAGIQDGSLNDSALGAVADHVKLLLAPYAEKVKDSLSDGHYRQMAALVFHEKDRFGGLYNTMKTHYAGDPTHQGNINNIVGIGLLIGDLESKIKNNSIEGLEGYFEKIAPNAAAGFKKAGYKDADINSLMDSGKKAYQALVSGLSESKKRDLQAHLYKEVFMPAFNSEMNKLDPNHIKSVINSASPVDLLALTKYISAGGGNAA